MLEYDPDDRMTTSKSLNHEFFNLLPKNYLVRDDDTDSNWERYMNYILKWTQWNDNYLFFIFSLLIKIIIKYTKTSAKHDYGMIKNEWTRMKDWIEQVGFKPF